MCKTILVTTDNKKGILFINPFIIRKDKLKFEQNTLGIDSEYDQVKKRIYLEIPIGADKRIIELTPDKETIDILDDFCKSEFKKVNDFYERISTKKMDIWISDSKVYTKELLNTGFQIYYLDLFIYSMNQILKTNCKTFNEVQDEIIKRVESIQKKDPKKFLESDIEDYGRFLVVPTSSL